MKNNDLQVIEREVRKIFQREDLPSIILFGSAVKFIKKVNDFDVLDVILFGGVDLACGPPFLFDVSPKNKVLWGKNIIPLFFRETQGITALMKGGKKIGWKIAQ